MGLHLIAEDLERHDWYQQLVGRTIVDVEAFVSRWAAFEELVATLGEIDPDEQSG